MGGEVLGYNLVAYCMNNPVNMSDPSGNWPKWATKLVAAVAVVAVGAATGAAIGYTTTGTWVSPGHYGSSARSLLSLPAGNTMPHTSSFLLPKGTSVLAGRAAPLFGRSGGGVQWWISVLG